MIYRTPLCYQSYSRGDFFMPKFLVMKLRFYLRCIYQCFNAFICPQKTILIVYPTNLSLKLFKAKFEPNTKQQIKEQHYKIYVAAVVIFGTIDLYILKNNNQNNLQTIINSWKCNFYTSGSVIFTFQEVKILHIKKRNFYTRSKTIEI